jgi:hypothetical protein
MFITVLIAWGYLLLRGTVCENNPVKYKYIPKYIFLNSVKYVYLLKIQIHSYEVRDTRLNSNKLFIVVITKYS